MWLYDRDTATQTSVDEGAIPYVWIFNAYPNPTTFELNLEVGLLLPGNHERVAFTITSLLGETVFEDTIVSQDIGNRSIIRVPVDDVSNGMYVVSLSVNSYTHSKVIAVFR